MDDPSAEDFALSYLGSDETFAIYVQQLLSVPQPNLGNITFAHTDTSFFWIQAIRNVHQRDIVHHDVSPNNVIYARSNEQQARVVLIDFGYAEHRPLGSSWEGQGVGIQRLHCTRTAPLRRTTMITKLTCGALV